jgi:hypothetical protein
MLWWWLVAAVACLVLFLEMHFWHPALGANGEVSWVDNVLDDQPFGPSEGILAPFSVLLSRFPTQLDVGELPVHRQVTASPSFPLFSALPTAPSPPHLPLHTHAHVFRVVLLLATPSPLISSYLLVHTYSSCNAIGLSLDF